MGGDLMQEYILVVSTTADPIVYHRQAGASGRFMGTLHSYTHTHTRTHTVHDLRYG